MAIVKKQGIWTDSVYPWTDTTSAGLMGSIVTEIDAWITAISSNASIVANGQLPVKVREPSDSTNSGTRNGFVYEFPDTTIGVGADGPTYPHLMVHGTQTSLVAESGDEFEDDTQNNGFGDMGSTPGHSSSFTGSGSSGYDNQAIIFYDDTDGQEFFVGGIQLGSSTSNSVSFGAVKDLDGRWMLMTGDRGFSYDNILEYWTGANGPYDTDPSLDDTAGALKSLNLLVAASTGANARPNFDYELQGRWYAANPVLYTALASQGGLGNYVLVSGGTEAIVQTGYNGFAVRVPV